MALSWLSKGWISSNHSLSGDRLQSGRVPSTVQTPSYHFDLSGGSLCLDFANTVSWRKAPARSSDHLNSYDDLGAFAEQSKMLSPQQADDLRAHARRYPGAAQNTFQKAAAFRENLYRAFSALAAGKPAASGDLRRISDFAVRALSHRRLKRGNGRYRWEWQWNEKSALDSVLWPIAQSAAELLTSPELDAVRMCEAADCAWLFLDQSRNRSRRWCDMKVCGNRQKARRHYQRTHK
jgi:predicted RNA-binding Zn ribbon-like protein